MIALVQPAPAAWPSPFDLFARLADRPGAFLLDSAWDVGGSAEYSFIGFDPFLTALGESGKCLLSEFGSAPTVAAGLTSLESLRQLLRKYRSSPHPQIPFVGGAVGYFSYELGASWEKVRARPDPSCPEFEFNFYDGLLAFNHAEKRWCLIANPVHTASGEQIVRRLLSTVNDAGETETRMAPVPALGRVLPRETPAAYLKSVQAIKDYIRAGDVYQANLAHAFDGYWEGHPFALYQRLRENTPAPFGAYLRTTFGHILSSSPERFFRLRNENLETRPIKGTRPRGSDPETDLEQRAELTASAKERAELLMIVDLERNDLGKVCVPGSIAVTDLYRVETHPTVFHLVATVTGKIQPSIEAIDVVRALFPGGSITGAPKIRAMQIIRELETYPRGPYTGAIGYLGFDGNADFNIAIRTIELRGNRASYQVGAGIVWDSDPQSEYEETLAKGRALAAALGGI